MKIKRFASATEIEKSNGVLVLVSYSTPVAAFVPGMIAASGVFVSREKYSATTSKHVSQFLSRHRFSRESANEVAPAVLAALLEGEPDTALEGARREISRPMVKR